MSHQSPSSDDNGRVLFDLLVGGADEIVPVVGSGMTVEANAPGFGALLDHLCAAADEAKCAGGDAFAAVDALADATSEEFIREKAAQLYMEAQLEPTPALQALTRVRTGLIITTNYDLAIEEAAEKVGRPVVSLTADNVAETMAPPSHVLRVLHLHGIANDPKSIVLTSESYRRIAADDGVQAILRDICMHYRLVFLGHRLDQREEHLRRDLEWAIQARRDLVARHVLITEHVDVESLPATDFRTELESATGIHVVMFADENRSYRATKRAASLVSGQSVSSAARLASPLDPRLLDQFYVPAPLAETAMLAESGGLGTYTARRLYDGDIYCSDLDLTASRLVLVGPGGVGKSQELLQVGLRSHRPALFQHLASWQLPSTWADPGRTFVAAMRTAVAISSQNHRTPQLTDSVLDDDSFVFLLDGLDEVRPDQRGSVVALINAVAAAYPQHRYVVSSRPITEIDDLIDFAQYTPVPDRGWLEEYTEKRGLPKIDLDAALPSASNLSDVVTIPIYAASAVDEVLAGNALPNTAIELVWQLADGPIGKDDRLLSRAADVTVWLDRVALAMEIAESPELDAEVLIRGQLHDGLTSIDPSEEFLGLLVGRALLAESAGIVRFPANVVNECRAGRALLNAGDDGLDLIRNNVLVTLEVRDKHRAPVTATRPSWLHTLVRLLEAAPESWRRAVAEYDPLLAARATPLGATADERHAAVWTIWNTYKARKVWIERSDGRGGGETGALSSLLRIEAPPGFRDEALAAVTSADEVLRGNALMALPYLEVADVADILRSRIADTNPVVRRRAAAAGLELNLGELVGDLVAQANVDDDELASRTLLDAAMDMADPEVAISAALNAAPRVRDHALRRVVRIAPRSRLLESLETESFDRELFHALTGDSWLARGRVAWTPEEVSSLARVVAREGREAMWDQGARRILRGHPDAAIRGYLAASTNDDLEPAIYELCAGIEPDAIQSILKDVKGTFERRQQEAGAKTQTLEIAIETLTRILGRRQQPIPDDVSTPQAEVNPPEPVAAEVEVAELRALFDDDGVASAIDRQTKTVSRSTIQTLAAAAEQNASLTPDQCAQLFEFLTLWRDHALQTWLGRQWTPEVAELVRERLHHLSGDELLAAIEYLPGPWPEGLAARALRSIAESELSEAEKLHRAGHVLDHGEDESFRTWALGRDEAWLDRLLVRIGDCSAEHRLIDRLAHDTAAIRRHPTAELSWLSELGCRSSVEPLITLIRAALTEGTPLSEAGALYEALSRCAGNNAIAVWDDLIADDSIPGHAFLFYQRLEAINALMAVQPPNASDPAIQAEVNRLVPGAQ